mgnify:CR=1 FL=1
MGEERTLELSYLRFDVTNFEKRLDQGALLQLPSDVRERLWLLDLDLAGDGDAVVGDRRGAELLVEDDVAALRAERHLDRVGEVVHAALERTAGVLVELQDLRHLVDAPSLSCA